MRPIHRTSIKPSLTESHALHRREKPEMQEPLTTFTDVATAKTLEYLPVDDPDERSTQEASKVRGICLDQTKTRNPRTSWGTLLCLWRAWVP